VDIKRETEGSLRSSSLKANSTDSAATKTGVIDWASIRVSCSPIDVAFQYRCPSLAYGSQPTGSPTPLVTVHTIHLALDITCYLP